MRISVFSTAALSAFSIAAPLAAADQPKFEVTSVKKADRCKLNRSADPATVTFEGYYLRFVLMEAFDLKTDQITGPAWLDEDCFDISAKLPEGATKEQIPAMLQALLAERFQLAFHKEHPIRPAYALVVDKGGPKFKETDPNGPPITGRPGTVFLFRAGSGKDGVKGSLTMATLTRMLSNKLHQPVHDNTGLEGKYDIDLSWTPDPPAAAADSPEPASTPGPSVFTAIRDSLGLKLEPRKEPVEQLVIDRIERIPTGN
jgi:uncharacterized protein (TIGR03435 family)